MSGKDSPHYFPNASNAFINNPRITHVSGNAYFGSSERHGLRLLLNNISNGAFHDAADRGDPPKCHPHTRTAIRTEIMEWIRQAPEIRRKHIIWMYGPAGSGKTAIGQSIAEECQKQGLLAASFFFSRTAHGRNDTSRLIATIAYQTSRFIPEIDDYLFTAIEQDPTIFYRTLATQIQVLVIEPLKSTSPSLKPVFVILDGIDECGPNAQSQTDLLNILSMAVSELHHTPLIFLIASRPEYEIREAFNGDILSSHTRSLVLNDNYKPHEDIKLYFNSKFQEIHNKHLRQGSCIHSPWPADGDINRLILKASGQFIFASTVIKFIDSPRHNPAERLDIIFGLLTPGSETPFAPLDALYHFILSSVADIRQVLEILTVLMLAGDYTNQIKLNANVIGELLGFDVRRALVDMHALVFVPLSTSDESALQIHHASLCDFLVDRSRSRDFYIDPKQGHLTLSRQWLKITTNYQKFRQFSSSFSDVIQPLMYHCRNSPADEVTDILTCLNLRQFLEDISTFTDEYCLRSYDLVRCLSQVDWNTFFSFVEQQAGNRVDIFLRLRNGFDAFILERLSRYPPALQAFIPAILTLSGLSFYPGDIFHILTYAVNKSQTEFERSRRLDSKLLDIENYPDTSIYYVFPPLFQDRSRAGQFYVDGGSYVALAMQIIRVICPRPGEDNHQIRLKEVFGDRDRYLDEPDSSYQTMCLRLHSLFFDWFPVILSNASTDFGLAAFLRERALQYGSESKEIVQVGLIPGQRKIARASLTYIQRCCIPYFGHTHRPHTTRCIVCTECRGACIVIGRQSSSPPSDPSSLSILPSTSDATSTTELSINSKRKRRSSSPPDELEEGKYIKVFKDGGIRIAMRT